MAIQTSGTNRISNAGQLQNITSLDSTTSNTISAASSPPTSYGAVGTYTAAAILYTTGGSGRITGGTTFSGSDLKERSGTTNGSSPFYETMSGSQLVSCGLSGTWRCMADHARFSVANYGVFNLFVRIS